MTLAVRTFLYGMLIPGILGLAAMAAVVLPGDGDDLSMTRLLIGCSAMLTVQVAGGLIGGYIAGCQAAHHA